jgi:hypothetical protein
MFEFTLGRLLRNLEAVFIISNYSVLLIAEITA